MPASSSFEVNSHDPSKMVKLHGPSRAQSSSLLLLPSEVRNQIWFLLFADSNVVYNKCLYDGDLSSKRYQVVHSCRFAYLDSFTLLWLHTKITYIDCIPTPNFASLRKQLTASAPCRKLITRLELDFNSTNSWQLNDLRGLRYFAPLKEVSIGPIFIHSTCLGSLTSTGLHHDNIENPGLTSFSSRPSLNGFTIRHGGLEILRAQRYLVPV